MSQNGPSTADSCPSYKLFDGGPVYRLEQKLGLVRDGEWRTGFRALFIALVCWAPLVVLSAVQGLAIGPTRLESFLMDFVGNERFLLTVPVFLFGEAIAGTQLRQVVRQFLDAGLVKAESRGQFESLVLGAVRLSRSGWTALVLLVLAYVHSAMAFSGMLFELEISTWRFPLRDGHPVLSLAGVWFYLVAFPIYSFLLWRWVLRIGLWWRFLWGVSWLDLRVSPSHRDEVGGLGFLSNSVEAFSPFVFGAGAIVAGTIADLVVYEGYSPMQYQWHIIGFVVLLLILIVGPLLFFIRPLYEAKEAAIFRYGAAASRQIQLVENKWLGEGPVREDLVASMPDFRSVTHFGHSVTAVRRMSLLPLNKEDVIKFVALAVLPLVPVFATQVPMRELFSILLKLVA